jgi:hypothetical protein
MIVGKLVVAACIATVTGFASAAERPLDLTLPDSKFYRQDMRSVILAENDADVTKVKNEIPVDSPSKEYEPKIFSGKKIHQYLGVTTAALAGMTFMTHMHPVGNGPRDVNGTHAELGKAAAAMALATVASGLMVHWDDFSLEDGWKDPDNLHVLLGVTGAALMAYAVNKSMNASSGQVNHAGYAELGALGMVVAIKLTW